MDMRALLEPKKAKKDVKPKKEDVQLPKVDSSQSNASNPNGAEPATPRSKNKSVPANTQSSPTTPRTYDPRLLLNPRASKTSSRKMDPDERNGNQGPNGGAGGFGFLESLHGAEKRIEQRPAKRAKIEENGQNEPRKASGQHSQQSRHGNAGVGDYFKRKADPNVVATSIPISSIDLTADDDDDDLEITGIRNIEDKEVCYGMIDGYVSAHRLPKPPAVNSQFGQGQWPVFKINLRRQPERGMTIACSDPYGQIFGYAEHTLADALAPAMDGFPTLRVQCRMLSRPKKPGELAHQPCSDKLRVVINLYGRKGDVLKIGRWFGQKNIWFKSPMVSDANIEIHNPHAQKRREVPGTTPSGITRITSTTRTIEEATEAVSKLFNYQADENNELPETEAPRNIKTPLLKHQKQALTFMLRQEQPRTYGTEENENSSLWRKTFDERGRPVFEEVVSGMRVMEEPTQCLGGLLADVMGLGKTIQALSLVASTASEAAHFEQQRPPKDTEQDMILVTQSRATLIVAPLSTVKNWEDQIREHTSAGSMLYYVYHGGGRDKDPMSLYNHDVVITTYGTAAHEIIGKHKERNVVSPLQQIRWFRIILDEAHTIRESKNSQAQAMYALQAERRWCLTGTPIQNRLDDLGSLTRFLKLFPYDTIAGFNANIKNKAVSGDPGFLKRLRVMVDSFTLRRLRDQIDLPPRQDLAVELLFSDDERQLHDFFREKYMVAVKQMTKEGKSKNTGGQYHRVLKGITTLRLICAHGKELLRQEELDQFKGENADEPIDLDDDNIPLLTIDEKAAMEHFSQLAEAGLDFCGQCKRPIEEKGPSSPDSDTEDVLADTHAVVLACKDIFCTQCFSDYKPAFDRCKRAGTGTNCPLMHGSDNLSPNYVSIPKDYADKLSAAPEETAETDTCLFKNGYYGGPHTKTKQLLYDIAEMNNQSRPLVENGEPPLKCVVFSEFTSHLDLIGKALADNDHEFVRIDGSMSLANRRKVIDALNKDDTVTILLASIKAAGQGLNLTAASRVFLMEPMWNPAAEAQAVDRVYRLGQTREVIIKRYRMQSSMEDKIVALQDRKKKVAELSLEKKAMQKELSKKERNEQSLKAMLDFFKA